MLTPTPVLLTTRAAIHNCELNTQLSDLPITTIEIPLLYYKDIFIDFRRFRHYRRLLVTSKYAAAVIAKKYLFPVEVLVVGAESAKLLDSNPHINVAETFNNAKALQEYLVAENGHDIPTLYLCGNMLTTDLKCYADCITLYCTIYRNQLGQDELEQLSAGGNYVFLYSENAARQFIYLCNRHDILQLCQKSVVITISRKVAKVVENSFSQVIAASTPSSTAMVNVLRAEICR